MSVSDPDCPDFDAEVTVSWEISGADVMYLYVNDGEHIDIAASGSMTFTFPCNDIEHTYYVVGEKDGVRTVKSRSRTA
jgi:hypothetical protein